ncbi:tyrosine-type recombinase/integrase [Indiicoccus explosivorum]|uniref:tyrosine-type recombinase/integrase n=1 Tax=Indiicoccus explosivorum TaxID=1917864 RepID=UPI000B43FEC0|nr:site-specific integrase [Indiicoccus explosivorum]
MPYGYEKFRLKNGISPNTVVHEVQLIEHLLDAVSRYHNGPVEPHEIRPSDIQRFFKEQRDKGLKDSTINRKLVFIRKWFDYMWQIGKIPVDFMPKFKLPEKLDLTPADIHLDYSELLNRQEDVLKSEKLALNAKILFLLYMRGLRVRDMTAIDVSRVQNFGHKLRLQVDKKDGYTRPLDFMGSEIPIIQKGIALAYDRGTPFLLASKVKDQYTEFQMGSLSDYTEALSEFLGLPVRSGDFRFAFVRHLYAEEGKNVEEIQETLGITLESAARILKEALTRVKPNPG